MYTLPSDMTSFLSFCIANKKIELINTISVLTDLYWIHTENFHTEFFLKVHGENLSCHVQSTLKFFDPGLLLTVQFHLPPSDPSYWLRYDDYVLPFFSQSVSD
jgi:hypothetical protein